MLKGILMAFVLIAALLLRTFMDISFRYSVHGLNFDSVTSILPNIGLIVKNYWLWVALTVAIFNFWLWTLVLSYYDLSFAYPLFSICYVWIMLAGKILFGEHLDKPKIVGMGLILVSSVLLIYS